MFGFKLKFFYFVFSFYGDWTDFVHSSWPWAYHGANWNNGMKAGEFAYGHNTGDVNNNHGSRLVEDLTIIYFSLNYYFFVIYEYYRSLIPILLIDKNLNSLL